MQLAPKVSKGFSISGVQIKLQAKVDSNTLKVVDKGGDYIIKPCPEEYPSVPENEQLTMKIHKLMGLNTPAHGTVPFKDGSMAYIIKRYDREQGHKTLHQEDMSSLLLISSGQGNEKYIGASCQQVLEFIYQSSKSQLEQLEYIKRLIMSYLLGNGDYHLKNISMISIDDPLQGEVLTLSPVYDVLNTSIYGNDTFVMSLDFLTEGEPIKYAEHGNGYYYLADFIELGQSVAINRAAVIKFATSLQKKMPKIIELVSNSFLPDELKHKYLTTITTRSALLSDQ